MNKFIKLLFLLSFMFTFKSSAMQIQELKNKLNSLRTNLETLKTRLTTLNQKLGILKNRLIECKTVEYKKEKKFPYESKFDQQALDIYALYGDDPNIILDNNKAPRKLIIDKDKNPRLVGLENQPYTGYGYKTANLKELEKVTIKMNRIYPENINFKVPEFIGISSKNIKDYLITKNLNIANEWKNNITNKISPLEQQNSLQTKTLLPIFLEEIQKIENSVKNRFLVAAQTNVNLDDIFKTSGINKFLLDTQTKKLKLMIRSTGKEDTDQLANAGGNETIGNVDPNSKEVLTAMGQGPTDPTTREEKLGVISSYFGKKSFTQRIKAGDPTIYEEPPTPVLLQVMIGETPDEITSCGVMFTEEPDGGISRKKEIDPGTGQILTTGITQIECSYGHNEGVVNSMVPVDVYYINHQKTVNSIIRKKDKRVIPAPQGFQIISNISGDKTKDQFIYQPALSIAEVKALKILADYLEFYYRKPMDVEFVLKRNPNNPTRRLIYIVQARPIVHNEKQIQASYIVNPDTFTEKITGEVIGIAGGSLRLIKNKNECVIAETLKEALELYQKRDNTEIINCIIVKNMSPATSHEATQFRTEQKAVICIPEIKKLENWLNETKNILVDLQQEFAVIWDGDLNLENAIKNDPRLKEGWINYPIPMKLTLSDQMDPKHKKKFSDLSVAELKEGLKNVISVEYFNDVFNTAKNQTSQELTKKVAGQSVLNIAALLKNIKPYFKSVKIDDETSAKLNLLKMCFGVSAFLLNQISQKQQDTDFIYQAKLILKHFLNHVKNVSEVLNISVKDPAYYKRLYKIRFLEAILFQIPSKDIFNNYSLETLIKYTYIKEKLIEKQLKQKVGAIGPDKLKLFIQYGRASDFILTDEVKQKWFALLKQLINTSPNTQKDFNHLFYELAENNLFTI